MALMDLEWKQSSFCHDTNCVQLSPWRKSTRCESSACAEVSWQTASNCESNGCVEVCLPHDTVSIRASGKPDVVVTFTRDEWEAFVTGVKNNEFDL